MTLINTLLELLGVALIAAWAGSFGLRWALLVAGLWLVLTSLARDLKGKEGVRDSAANALRAKERRESR